MQVNSVCMWSFRDWEGPEDARTIVEPELICRSSVGAGVTDLCFLDEWSFIAGLENGSVVLFQYSASTEVSVILGLLILIRTQHFSCYLANLLTLYLVL